MTESKIEIPEVLPGNLHSRISTVDLKKETPSGGLKKSDYNASNSFAMYLCRTSFP